MKVDADKRFIRDFQSIQDNKIRDKIELIVKKITSASDIPNLEKIKGSEGYYRIKFDYRYIVTFL
jgi:intein/homing endonuclease